MDQEPGHTTEVIIHIDMAVLPVLLLHVLAQISEHIEAAGKHTDKKITGIDISGDRIINGKRITSPVNFRFIARLVFDPYREPVKAHGTDR